MHLTGEASNELTDPGIFTQGSALVPCLAHVPLCPSCPEGLSSPLLSGTPSCLFEPL